MTGHLDPRQGRPGDTYVAVCDRCHWRSIRRGRLAAWESLADHVRACDPADDVPRRRVLAARRKGADGAV